MLRNVITLRATVAVACLTVAGGAVSGAAEAATISHAMTTAGHAQGGSGTFGCATSGPQALVRNFFNQGIGLPTEGYAGCHLSGDIDDNTAAGATSADSSATAAFNNGMADVSAAAHADYDQVGTQAEGTFTGYTDAFSYHASEAAALTYDTLNITGGTGNGTITMGFTIDGALNAVGNSEAFTQLAYQLGDGPIYGGFYGRVSYGANAMTAYNGSDLSGFAASDASISGSGLTYTFDLPIIFGQTYDWNVGLYSAAYPGPFGGDASSSFFSTAKLTSIAVKNASGQAVDFAITSQSGTTYDASGAHLAAAAAVPEPATWAMMIAGFGAIGASLRRRRSAGMIATG